ncbi:biotin/lipoyl-containing protein, partial [Kitasatospora sp. NPDC054939]
MTAIAPAPPRFRRFPLPDVGEGLTEAEILRWHVAVGDRVRDGQIVCEVETAKAAVELPIPFDGLVHSLGFPEGATVDVGAAIITVDTGPAEGAPADPAPAPIAPADLAAPTAPTAAAAVPPAPPALAADCSGAAAAGRKAVLVGYGVAPA